MLKWLPVVALVSACAASPSPRHPIIGLTSQAHLEAALPAWRAASESAVVDAGSARRLADVAPGARIDAFVGTWCSDSRREASRLFRTLELVPKPHPFTIRWIGVDQSKLAPGYTEGADVRFVPTFVVRRDGREIGRIVESAPHGIERDLLDLLSGRTSGVISARTGL